MGGRVSLIKRKRKENESERIPKVMVVSNHDVTDRDIAHFRLPLCLEQKETKSQVVGNIDNVFRLYGHWGFMCQILGFVGSGI